MPKKKKEEPVCGICAGSKSTPKNRLMALDGGHVHEWCLTQAKVEAIRCLDVDLESQTPPMPPTQE